MSTPVNMWGYPQDFVCNVCFELFNYGRRGFYLHCDECKKDECHECNRRENKRTNREFRWDHHAVCGYCFCPDCKVKPATHECKRW